MQTPNALKLRFKLDRLERKDWYWTINTQFFKKLSNVDTEYNAILYYNDTHFDNRIEEIDTQLYKDKQKVDGTLFPEQIKSLEEDAKNEIQQIENERAMMLHDNPDIHFTIHRSELKEKAQWTMVKWMIYDKHIITRLNDRIEIMHNYKIKLESK